jgi:hypothetical protein
VEDAYDPSRRPTANHANSGRRQDVILIGMPGMEKRLSRYPQLYSRIGFAHHYRPLQGDELTFVLTRHWRRLGLALDDAVFTDAQAIASIARITGGNFRLLHRLFVQIGRILKINGLAVVTDDVSKPPAAPLRSAPHSTEGRPPLISEGHNRARDLLRFRETSDSGEQRDD